MKINLDEFTNLKNKLSEDEQDLDETRFFCVVDENYEDIDDEEVDVFDPNDYNYLIYITERVSNILKEEGLKILREKLEKEDYIENFLASEEDLYGIKSHLSDEEIALNITKLIDKIIGEMS